MLTPCHRASGARPEPDCELADVFRRYGPAYRSAHRLPYAHHKVMNDYFGRYIQRVAITNDRLRSCDDGQVSFHYRDRSAGNSLRVATLSADEFVRRFLQHVLPKGFQRIRHYRCRQLLEVPRPRRPPRRPRSGRIVENELVPGHSVRYNVSTTVHYLAGTSIMPAKTQRGRGRSIQPGGAGALFPSPAFIRENLTPARRQAGLIALLARLNYPTTDAEEPAVASVLASPNLTITGARRIAQTKSLGKEVRVWTIEVDKLAKITDANPLIHKSRQFAAKYSYLLVVTDYERYLWVYPRGDVVYKLWLDGQRVYHSDLKTLSLLRLPSAQANWFEILTAWKTAFNVERVTEDFFRDYVEAQQVLQDAIRPRELEEAQRFEYAQLLLGRLMFLYFLQKKGWLGEEGQSAARLKADYDYLQRKYQETRAKSKGNDFYDKFLKALFLKVLCVPRPERPAAVTRQFGEIPFLNGGLFHPSEIEKTHKDLEIPDAAFDPVLNAEDGLFRKYNFTVREDEPLDRQVAVDPEMLGKIFERQVVGREVKGAFYTPGPVVDYMCRESLKAYLLAHAAGAGGTPVWDGGSPVPKEAILDLLEMAPAEELDTKTSRVARLSDQDAIRLDQLLDRITVIDPAVGSGAFPVGVLHRLVDLRCALIRRSNGVARDRVRFLNDQDIGRHGKRLNEAVPNDGDLRYVLKRRIIQRNLFGVDIERYAIQIAQLRLWLSLAVEHEVQYVHDIQPLPNLDLNLVIGNSLIDAFRPLKSKEAFDLELELRSPKEGSRIAGIAARIEKLTLDYVDMESEDEKEKQHEEIDHLHRELLREQIDRALEEIPGKIRAVESKYLSPDLLDTHDGERVAFLRHQQEELPRVRAALANGAGVEGSRLPMLWTTRFPHIFKEREGFDICIANPPYVSTQGASDLPYVEDLKAKAGFNDDFYVFFAYRALGHPERERMLPIARPGGVVCFITSDTYFTLNTKTHLRELLQSKRLLKIGQLDPFQATVDAAIFLAQNRPALAGEETEFFQARFVDTLDELNALSDRPAAGRDRWQPEAEFLARHSRNFISPSPPASGGEGWGEGGQNPTPKQDSVAENEDETPIPVVRDQTCGGFDGDHQRRTGVYRYQTDPVVWRSALKHAFFEPSRRNAALYNRFMGPLVKLVDEWWDKIEDSRKFEQNLPALRAYHKSLKPGDVTLVGLICEGGQGMAPANNGRFLGYLEGTPQADAIQRRQDELRKLWSEKLATAKAYQRLARKFSNFPELADAMKAEIDDWTGALGLKRGEIYRVVPKKHVVEVDALTEAEKREGIKAVNKCWVPYRKGDPEGNKWVSFDPLYIFWSRENVEWLSDRTNPLPRWQGYKFFFTEGITWTRGANHVCIKARIQPKCVFDVNSLRLTPIADVLSAKAFLAILNSDLASFICKRFLNNTWMYQIGDLRLLPLIWPAKEQEDRLAELAKRAIRLQTELLQSGKQDAAQELLDIQAKVDEAVEALYGVEGLGPFNEF